LRNGPVEGAFEGPLRRCRSSGRERNKKKEKKNSKKKQKKKKQKKQKKKKNKNSIGENPDYQRSTLDLPSIVYLFPPFFSFAKF
jgi:hypothetical protein